MRRKRFAALTVLPLALAFAGVLVAVALASPSDNGTPGTTTGSTPGGSGGTTTKATTRSKPRQKPTHGTGAHPFAPDTLRGASEVSGVILDVSTHQFKKVVFDRGRVTAVSSNSITLQQKQNSVLWRTQAFDVPASATVMLMGKPSTLANVRVGSAARIESSGPVGGSVTVVKINVYNSKTAPLPSTSGGSSTP